MNLVAVIHVYEYLIERKELEMPDCFIYILHVYSMYIPCIFHLYSIYIPCIFHYVLQEFLLSKGKEFFLEQNKGLLSHLPGNYHG